MNVYFEVANYEKCPISKKTKEERSAHELSKQNRNRFLMTI